MRPLRPSTGPYVRGHTFRSVGRLSSMTGAALTYRGEPPLARLTAVFAIVVAMAACSDTTSGSAPEPAPALAPAPAPEPAPAPAPDALEALTPEAAATREALLAAAVADDWGVIGALFPEDGQFTSNFGGETGHIAFYRSLDLDLTAEIVALLEGPFAQRDGFFIWPELHVRVPFEFAADERADLEARFGGDALEQWEAAGSYLGWRIGITEAGDWRFFVAGD